MDDFDFTITGQDRIHLVLLLEWFHNEVMSAGGDGDGIWLTKNHSVKSLYPLVLEVFKGRWKVTLGEKDILCLAPPEESFLITEDVDKFLSRPHWQQVALDY